MPKAVNNKLAVLSNVKDLALTNMAAYHRATDWAELWEDWYLSLNPNGRPKYATIQRFARAKAKNEKQLAFLLYYLGQDDPGHGPLAEFKFVSPQNWQKKRDEGGWAGEENIKELHRAVSTRLNGLDALRQVGNNVTLHSVARAEQLAAIIDREFSYGRLPEELDYKERVARLKDYLGLHAKLAEYQEQIVLLYAKCHGINFDDMNGLAALITASAITSGETKSASRVEQALSQLTQMTLIKGAKFKTPLPPGSDKIIEAEVSVPQPSFKEKIQ